MYQSKLDFSPGVSESESSEERESESELGIAGEVPESAACAATRCDLDSGISQSGRVLGTSLYSWRFSWHRSASVFFS